MWVYKQEEKEALLAKNHIVLRKVRDVLEDEDLVDKIMKKYNKQAESKEEYITNREKRIKELLEIARVTLKEYLKALGTSKSGYSIVQHRDLDIH